MSATKGPQATLPDAPDPLHYVPLPEHERALSALRDALDCGMNRIVLLGPPGFGKSLLLRRLKADPPPSARVFYLPFANLGAEELATWLLSWMGVHSGAIDDEEFLVWTRVEKRLGRRCVLLLDEAQSLPLAAAKRLDDWVARSQGALQIVLAGIEGEELDTVLEGFAEPPHRVGLRKALRGEALRNFANALIARTIGERRNAPTWLWEEKELFRATEGVPRVVKSEIRARLEKAERQSASAIAPAQVDAARRAALPKPPAAPPKRSDTAPGVPIRKAAPRHRRRRRWLPAATLLVLVGALLWPSVRGPAVPESNGAEPTAAAEQREVQLHVNAFPWAEIRVDGESVGITPLAGLEVVPGRHELLAVFPDGREVIKNVELRAASNSITFP